MSLENNKKIVITQVARIYGCRKQTILKLSLFSVMQCKSLAGLFTFLLFCLRTSKNSLGPSVRHEF